MRKLNFCRLIPAFICLSMLFSTIAQAKGNLPKAAKTAIKEAFPGAKIGNVDSKREFGVLYYDVEVRQNGVKKEVQVSANGIIGEIDYKIKPSELPKNLQEIVRDKIRGGRLIRIEKHERLGSAKSGTWETLATPTIMYDVKFRKNGKKGSFIVEETGTVGSDPKDPVESVKDEDDEDDYENGDNEQSIAVEDLPEAVINSIQKAFSKGEMGAVSIETENGVQMYEVEVTQNKIQFDVGLSEAGEILEIANNMNVEDLPNAVQQTLKNEYAECVIQEVERKYADKKLVFIVEINDASNVFEVVIDPKGNILSTNKADG